MANSRPPPETRPGWKPRLLSKAATQRGPPAPENQGQVHTLPLSRASGASPGQGRAVGAGY